MNIFSSKPAHAGLVGLNAQQIGLQPLVSLNPSAPVGGGDIGIVASSALLPDAGPSGTAADIGEPVNDQISIYVVRKGDTLSEIAKMFNVSVNTIVWANDLDPKKSLVKGQTLTILPVSGIRHVVAKGDTVPGLAKKYKGDEKEIRQFNNLTGDQLTVGDTIIIPDGEETPPPLESSPKRPGTNPYRGGSGPDYPGYYLRPIVGGVKTQGLHGYNGVDLASSLDTPILASAAGTVIVSRSGGWNGGYGNYVVIQHGNNTQTLYSHLDYQIVSVGQQVQQGQVIGYMGATGKVTGVHLHFEIRGAKNPF